jgi:hypothetical protein
MVRRIVNTSLLLQARNACSEGIDCYLYTKNACKIILRGIFECPPSSLVALFPPSFHASFSALQHSAERHTEE